MTKKLDNRRNFASREAWLKAKRANRPKQVWTKLGWVK